MSKHNTKRFYVKLAILLSCLSLISHVGYRYLRYCEVFDPEILKAASMDLSDHGLSFVDAFGEEDLSIKGNLERMMKSIANGYTILDKYRDLLKYGYEVKFYGNTGVYMFCLYGEDRKRSKKNVLLYDAVNEEDVYSIKELNVVRKPSFLDYYFNYSDFDILLFAYRKNGNCTERPDRYTFFKGTESVYPHNSERLKLVERIKNFQNKRVGNASESLRESKESVFFKYDSGKVSILCDTLATKKEFQKIKEKLQMVFDSIELQEIDFGIFPVTTIASKATN